MIKTTHICTESPNLACWRSLEESLHFCSVSKFPFHVTPTQFQLRFLAIELWRGFCYATADNAWSSGARWSQIHSFSLWILWCGYFMPVSISKDSSGALYCLSVVAYNHLRCEYEMDQTRIAYESFVWFIHQL